MPGRRQDQAFIAANGLDGIVILVAGQPGAMMLQNKIQDALRQAIFSPQVQPFGDMPDYELRALFCR